jgi:hypothetical protein
MSARSVLRNAVTVRYSVYVAEFPSMGIKRRLQRPSLLRARPIPLAARGLTAVLARAGLRRAL